MTTKVYRDEESFEGLDKSSSSAYFDEQKLPEIPPVDYLNNVNKGTRRTNNIITGSITLGGTTKVIETVSEFQSAIDNLTPTDGGTLYLKPGIYNVNQPLRGITGLKIVGESSKNTIVDFGATTANLSFIGTDMYTTGTVGAVTSGVIVTGVGTSWLSIENPSTKQLFMENKWYRISSVTNDTTLILSEGVTDTFSYPINYKIGKPIEDIDIDEVTIRNSGTTALVFTDCRDITLRNVITQTSAKGITMDNCFIISTKKVFSYSNASHGFEFNSCAFSSFEDMLSIGNGGNGFTYNNCKTMPLYSCAAISNVGDGINFTNTDDVYMEMELTGNGGQGAELVSGNKSILFRQCAVRSNISDGIKFTATSDECGILACNIESNGGYGINIANANCDNNIVSSNILKSNTTANGIDNGTGTVIRGNVGWADNAKFIMTDILEFSASDTLQQSADTERSEALNAYVKLKEIEVKRNGTIRVAFDLKSEVNFTAAFGRIYINGVATGTERSTVSTAYVNYSEDLTVAEGDLVQLYAKHQDADPGNSAFVRNFRLYWDTVNVDQSNVLTD